MSTRTDDRVEQPEPSAPDIPVSDETSLIGYAHGYWERFKGGELGSVPAVIGLVVITAFFSIVHKGFLSAYNIEALVFQAAAVIIMAMGLIFVLLLGEIDLSAGTTGGLCSAITAVLFARHHVNEWIAIAAAIVVGMAIGFIMGWLRSRIGIPSFVITLATFLAFQGITVLIVGGQGAIQLQSGWVLKLENNFLPLWLGWTLLGVLILGYAAVKLNDASNRRRAGLHAVPYSVIAFKVIGLAAAGGLFTYIMGINRIVSQNTSAFFPNHKDEGMPWAVLLIAILFVFWNFALTRTRYGRHVFALGGNEEAARRAGIPINRIRISVFVICSGMAAVSGLVAASQISSVGSAAGAGNTLLLAVGAAVIGGTSLFGGRGRMIDAVIGGLVVEVIYNGMANLISGSDSGGVQQIVTGGVLLLAAGFDAVVRSRNRAR